MVERGGAAQAQLGGAPGEKAEKACATSIGATGTIYTVVFARCREHAETRLRVKFADHILNHAQRRSAPAHNPKDRDERDDEVLRLHR